MASGKAACALSAAAALLGAAPASTFVPPSPHRLAFRRAPVLRPGAPPSGPDLAAANLESGFGIGTAEATDVAVAEAAEAAAAGVGGGGGSGSSIAFVSCTVLRDVEEVRRGAAAALPPGVPIHGLTTSAAILTKDGTKGGAVGVLLIKSDVSGSFAAYFDAESGEAAVKALKEKMADPQVVLMSATPGAEEGIIASLGEAFPGVPVYGGTAADDDLSGAWKVFSRDASSGTGVSLVGVSHNVNIGASMLGPYTETSQKVVATKAEGRRVLEINSRPAADWVYEWLGDDVKEQYEQGGLILPQTAQKPVGIKKPSGEFVTNHLAALGGEEKFVDFFAPIPEGAELIVMDSGTGPSTGYADAFARAYDEARAQGSLGGGEPKAGILVFCGGMAIAVGDSLDAGLTSEGFAGRVGSMPMLGVTCFGEQAQLAKERENVQRNLSVGMILLG